MPRLERLVVSVTTLAAMVGVVVEVIDHDAPPSLYRQACTPPVGPSTQLPIHESMPVEIEICRPHGLPAPPRSVSPTPGVMSNATTYLPQSVGGAALPTSVILIDKSLAVFVTSMLSMSMWSLPSNVAPRSFPVGSPGAPFTSS